MAYWQRTLDIKDIWQLGKKGEVSFMAIAKEIVEKLKKLKPFSFEFVNEGKENIIKSFLEYIEDEGIRYTFYEITCALYDWGDISLDSNWPPKKVCWIQTF